MPRSGTIQKVVIFDVDGTLTQTVEVDTELYVEALKHVLRLDDIDTAWATYRHVTDPGIAGELIERQFGRPPFPAEIEAIRDRFADLFDAALTSVPEQCQAVPGAAALLASLREHPDVECGVATGGWKRTALLKLRCAGLSIDDLPLATGDDAPSREDILRTAFQRAQLAYRLGTSQEVLYVGDGVWDLWAAKALGWRFLGVGDGSRADTLRAAGADRVVSDFTDLDSVWRCLF